MANNISILYEDSACAVVNKPAGVLTHSASKIDNSATLSQWWAREANLNSEAWPEPSRAGIIHRLDKDTSGAIVLAKSPKVLKKIQDQFQNRSVKKKYIALVAGVPHEKQGIINTKISRNQKRRTKKTSSFLGLDKDAREAISEYKLITIIDKNISLVQFTIKTGRTHQVRLHAKTIGTPILGDPDYNTKMSRKISSECNVKRQMLHAVFLHFKSPQRMVDVDIFAPVPSDMRKFFTPKINKALAHAAGEIGNNEKIFVLTGPSGAGKGSVASALIAMDLNLEWVRTLTSRPERPDDRFKSKHFFVTKSEFQKMVEKGEILEYNLYNGNYYGTPRYAVIDVLTKKKHPLLDIDVNGALAIKKIYDKQAVVIFIEATKDEIIKRLHDRGMPDTVINQRLSIRESEIKMEERFDYSLHNKQDQLYKTVANVKKIITRELQ